MNPSGSDLRDDAAARRFEQDFDGGQVWADYAVADGARVILHVEAEPPLRGTGASGRFMQALAEHAREAGFRMIPRCGYAVAWHRRHPDYNDVLA